jgi:hypothetical protein
MGILQTHDALLPHKPRLIGREAGGCFQPGQQSGSRAKTVVAAGLFGLMVERMSANDGKRYTIRCLVGELPAVKRERAWSGGAFDGLTAGAHPPRAMTTGMRADTPQNRCFAARNGAESKVISYRAFPNNNLKMIIQNDTPRRILVQTGNAQWRQNRDKAVCRCGKNRKRRVY